MDDAASLELELKLEAEADALETLAAAPILADVPFVEKAQHATYFDTPDRALHAAGLTLRVRRTGDAFVQTIKAEGDAAAGLFARSEWERELADDRPMLDAGSGPIATLLPDLAAHALAPAFTVAVRRRSGIAIHEGAEIEVVIDLGEVRAGDAVEPVTETELELKAGPPAALFALARAMNAAAPLRLGVRAKSDRGHALLDGTKANKAVKAWPQVLAGEMTAGAAFARIAGACVRQFRLNEAILLRTEKADALHQARVALRKLRSTLSTCRPLLADDPRFEPLRGELRWLATALGEARDIDVLLARGDPALADALGAARTRAYAEVAAALGSQRARTLMLDLAEWIALGDWRSGDAAAQPADRFAAEALAKLRRRIKRRGKRLETLSDEARHEVRILAKKLRYATEFFRPLFPGRKAARRGEAFAAALADLQEQLGELNDLAHGPHVLARLGLAAGQPAAPERRDALIARAADAHDKLVDARRFWR